MVASHVGAWIETSGLLAPTSPGIRRVPRGRVD